jgi:lipopolysaccharide/colanic/teichoic acid biosynthesis glycosyltransferase
VTLSAPAVHVAEAAAAAVTEPEGFYLRFGKRIVDVLGALFGLVFGLPLMGLAALIIKLESRGPVLYRSQRIGRGGHAFTFYKLRSMMDGADRHRHRLSHLNEADGPVFKMSRDPRVTRVGRFLRMSSLDELPQLFNVLRGEMSLVGPRPPIPEEVSQYEPWQFRRLAVKPGLTCLWQISGRSRLGFQEWMRLDLEYIRHQSLALDVKILVRTVPAVLSREGAY